MSDELNSLREALNEAADAQLENQPLPETKVEPTNEDDQKTTPDPDTEQTAKPTADPEKSDELEPLVPVGLWSAPRKELFAKLVDQGEFGREVQQAWLDREKEFEDGIQEKSQDAAQYRQTAERYSNAIAPIRQTLQMQGINEEQWIGQMAAYTTALASDPAGVIRAVAKQYGVDLGQFGEKSDEFNDPQIQTLTDKIDSLTTQFSQTTQTQQANATTQQAQALESFRTAVDADNNPLHPHFDAVMKNIVLLAQGHRSAGQQPPSIEDLYNTAVLMNPELTAESQRQAQAEADKKKDQERIEAAKKAKSGAARPKSSASGEEIKPQSLRETIAANYDAQGAS